MNSIHNVFVIGLGFGTGNIIIGWTRNVKQVVRKEVKEGPLAWYNKQLNPEDGGIEPAAHAVWFKMCCHQEQV